MGEEAILSFQNDEKVTIMIISLRAGGVGITLTAASEVIIMDPWWNPAVEEQAIDRIHHVGQTKPVKVIRIIVSDSVEEDVLEQQKKKGIVAAFAICKHMSDD